MARKKSRKKAGAANSAYIDPFRIDDPRKISI